MATASLQEICELRAPESEGPVISAEGSFTGRPLILPLVSLVA